MQGKKMFSGHYFYSPPETVMGAEVLDANNEVRTWCCREAATIAFLRGLTAHSMPHVYNALLCLTCTCRPTGHTHTPCTPTSTPIHFHTHSIHMPAHPNQVVEKKVQVPQVPRRLFLAADEDSARVRVRVRVRVFNLSSNACTRVINDGLCACDQPRFACM